MENKQTAVEWFYQRILAKDIKEVFEQAKQIEKEQIIAANEDSSTNELGEFLTGEQYYQETYNKS
jgi:hypothetical protein